jgi:hypothetical protein
MFEVERALDLRSLAKQVTFTSSEELDDFSLQTQPDGLGRIVDEIADNALVVEDVASGARLDFLIGALAARHVGTEQFLGDLQLTAHRINTAAQQYESVV